MVRLEERKMTKAIDYMLHFNSTMVRLEVAEYLFRQFNYEISIPRWYD